MLFIQADLEGQSRAVSDDDVAVSLGKVIRKLLGDRDLDQSEVATAARLRPAQMSKIVNGGSVLSEQYEAVARALKFRNALEMFRAPDDRYMRQLMRVWPALSDRPSLVIR